MKKSLFALLLLFPFANRGLNISPEAKYTIKMPEYIMADVDSAYNVAISGGRSRYATSTSVSWLNNNTLVASHLCGKALFVYSIKKDKVSMMQAVENVPGDPELDAVSPDGQLYAVSVYNHLDTSSTAKVCLYSIENNTLHLKHVISDINKEYNSHGVRFSPDGNFLVYTTINNPGYINVCKKTEKSNFAPNFSLQNAYYPLKPKGIDFSPDGKFLVAVYALRAGTGAKSTISGVAVYKFNEQEGTIQVDPVYYSQDLDIVVPENVTFYPDGSYLFISNQASDSVVVYNFDYASGKILHKECELLGVVSQFSFPHGFSISPDGKYLALASYGESKVSVFEIFN